MTRKKAGMTMRGLVYGIFKLHRAKSIVKYKDIKYYHKIPFFRLGWFGVGCALGDVMTGAQTIRVGSPTP